MNRDRLRRLAVCAVGVVTLAVVPSSPVGAVAPACGELVGGVHVVTSAAELAAVGTGSTECRLSDGYELDGDITLSGAWTPIGTSTDPFVGTFDGNDHTISGLSINDPTADEQGLFGYTGTGAEVRDVRVEGTVSAGQFVGGLIGDANGTTISNVSADVEVTGTNVVGGLIGRVTLSTVSASSADGTVTNSSVNYGVYGTGGLIGVGEQSSISGSTATGDVNASTSSSVGGLLGDTNTWLSIVSSSAHGDVMGGDYAGGLVGYAYANDAGTRTLTEVHTTGAVSGRDTVGGLVGYLDGNWTVSNATAAGQVTASAGAVGGLLGWAYSHARGDGVTLTVENVSTGGDVVAGGAGAGGPIGWAVEAEVSNASVTEATVTGTGDVGGLIGRMESTHVSRSTSEAAATGTNGVGGLVGVVYVSSGDTTLLNLISESAAYGDASASATVGGLVGYVDGSLVIERSFAMGDVNASTALGSGASEAGGLVGYGYDTKVEDSFSRSDVTAVDATGGSLFGVLEDGGAGRPSVLQSYAAGAVVEIDPNDGNGLFNPGGLVHVAVSSPTVSASFWDASVSGVTSSSEGGDPKSTAELTAWSTFDNADWAIAGGWVASNPPSVVWGICPAVNNGYPFLLWAYTSNPCGNDDPEADPPSANPTALPALLTPETPRPPSTTPGTTVPSPVSPVSPASPQTPTTSDSTPDPLPPGDSAVRLDGDAVDSSTTVIDGTTLETSVGRTVVRVGVVDSTGRRRSLDLSRGLVLSPGKRLALSASGYSPGARVRVDVFSDPVLLASVVADADGNIVLEAVVPEQLPSGAHTLRITGANADGGVLEITHGVLMEPVSVDEPATAEPLATQLPATGRSIDGLLLWTAIVLALGVVAVRTARPRP